MLNQETIRNCINKINKIALKSGCFDTSDEYIDLMIISEKSQKGEGWKGRVESLIQLKAHWKYARDIYKGEGVAKTMEEYIKSVSPDDMIQTQSNYSRVKGVAKDIEEFIKNLSPEDMMKAQSNYSRGKKDSKCPIF